jgi:hypothetical protein
MKCICGYEKLEDWQTDDNKAVGDEDFIRIDCFGKAFETDKKCNDYYGNEYRKAFLFACPKCGTVRMEYNY